MVAKKTGGTDMSMALPPITEQKLDAFTFRRNALLSTRGICGTACVSIAVLLLSVLVDAIFDLPWTGQILLSLVFYLSAIVTLLIGLVLPLLYPPNRTAIARVIETLAPTLRDKLLPAVELSQNHDPRTQGSPAFTQHLQQQVADEVAALSIAGLLPISLLRRWLIVTTIVVVVFAALWFWPAAQMDARVARILLPTANLGRPTSTKISVLRPSPNSQTIAANEIIEFQVQVERLAEFQDAPVRLQVETADTSIQEISLLRETSPNDPNENNSIPNASLEKVDGEPSNQSSTVAASAPRWSSTFAVGPTDLRYRIAADGALTPWFDLPVRARPQAIKFTQRLSFPTYAAQAPVEFSSDEGHVRGVIGSQVQLRIDSDQPLSRAALYFRAPQHSDSAADEHVLSEVDPQCWQSEWELSENRTYRFAGTSSETGLDSVFGNAYRVEVAEDLPPTLAWDSEIDLQQVVPAAALLDLRMTLTDEFSLADARCWWRVDRGPWQVDQPLSVPEPSFDAAEIRYAMPTQWKFDLFDKSLSSGQLVELKVVATDRKGQTRESGLMMLAISAAKLDTKLSPQFVLRLQMLKEARQFEAENLKLLEDVERVTQVWRENQAPEHATALQSVAPTMSDQMATRARRLRQQWELALPLLDSSVDGNEVERMLEFLAHLEHQFPDTLARRLGEVLDAGDDNQARDRHYRLADTLNDFAQQSRKVRQVTQQFLSHDILEDLGDDLHAALQFAESLAKNDADIGGQTWQRQQSLLSEHLRQVSTKMLSHAAYMREDKSNQMRDWSHWAASVADQIDQLQDQDFSELQQAVDRDGKREQTELAERLAEARRRVSEGQRSVINELNYHQNVSQIDGDSTNQSLSGQQELAQHSGNAWRLLEQVAENLEAQNSNATAATSDVRSLLQPLRFRRQYQWLRQDPDGRYAADLGTAYRAAQKILSQAQAPGLPATSDDPNHRPPENSADPAEGPLLDRAQRLRQAVGAMKKLDVAHRWESAMELLEDVQQRERFPSQDYARRSASPREWDNFNKQIQWLHEAAQQAQFANEVNEALGKLRWEDPLNRINQTIGSRRWDQNQKTSASSDLDTVKQRMHEAKTLMQATVDQARRDLESFAPSLADLARAAAEESREQQTHAEALAVEQQENGIPNLTDRLDRDFARQMAPDAPLRQIQDALQELASAQNLLETPQRQRAQDADLARTLAQQSQQQVTQAMAEVVAAPQPNAERKLNELADQQQQAAKVYDQIADHFENVQRESQAEPAKLADAQQASQASREALAQAAKHTDAELAQQALQSQYQDAEKLQALAEMSPRDLLKQLEAELRRSQEMQNHLSDISQDIAAQAEQSLRAAAEQEQQHRIYNEASDPAFAHEKAELKRELDSAAQQAQQLAQRFRDEAANAAQQADAADTAEQLRQGGEKLQQAAQQAAQVPWMSEKAELDAAAQALANTLQDVAPKAAAAAESLEAASAQERFQDKQLADVRRSLDRWQTQLQRGDVQRAEQRVRQQENQVRDLDNQKRKAEQNVRQNEKQFEQKQKQAERKSDEAWAQQEMRQAEQQLADARQEEKFAQMAVEKQQQRVERAQQQKQQAEQQNQSGLEGNNPAAQLAQQLSQQAAEQSQALAETLAKAIGAPELQAGKQQVRGVAEQQASMKMSLQQQAVNLERAAAHEQRLQQEQAAQALSQAAASVRATAEREIPAVAQAAAQAGRETSNNEAAGEETAGEDNANAGSANATAAQSAEVQQRLTQAQQRLTATAEDLAKIQAAAGTTDDASSDANNGSAHSNAAPSQARRSQTANSRESSPANEQAAGSQAAGLQAAGSQAAGSQANDTAADRQPSSASADALSMFSPQTKAQMLDQLDQQQRQTGSQANAGPPTGQASSENRSAPSPSQNSSNLAEAAQRLAQQMNQNRQQQGMPAATLSQPMPANADQPAQQSMVGTMQGRSSGTPAAQVIDLPEPAISADWSRLREQNAADVIQGTRETVAPRYQKQVEAYFENLARQRQQ